MKPEPLDKKIEMVASVYVMGKLIGYIDENQNFYKIKGDKK